jgi:putative transposase
MRKIKFENDKFYHICNRGVDKREVFSNDKNFLRFLEGAKEFNQKKPIGSLYLKKQIEKEKNSSNAHRTTRNNTKKIEKLVEIIAYALLPNHFHLLLKQKEEKGISEFMKRLGGGYTNYFNIRNHRSGCLFQGTYKAVKILSDEQLIYVSAYINGNSEIHKIALAEKWTWSSYGGYLGAGKNNLIESRSVMKQFKNKLEYKKYLKEVIKESGKRKEAMKLEF